MSKRLPIFGSPAARFRAFLEETSFTRKSRRVYVAGPMTGLPDFNYPAFHAAAAELRANGMHVENPAEHGTVDGAEWSDYLGYDLGRLGTCGAIYMLPGWEKSKGAQLEMHVACTLGLVVLYAPEAKTIAEAAPAVPHLDAEPMKQKLNKIIMEHAAMMLFQVQKA